MLIQLLCTALLLAISVLIHALVLTSLFRRTTRWPALATSGFLLSTWHMIVVAWWITLAHVAEILVWGLFYARMGIFPDLATAEYFSIVTYTTVGYGDLVPPERWRLLAGVEALTGLLMAGWSTAFFFSFANQWHSRDANREPLP
jgi:hypothetical protein